jgi:hypothetical protein
MNLSKAQMRVLTLAQSAPDHRYNGRIRRTVEVLEKHGLVTSEMWLRQVGLGRGNYTEVWTVEITDAGRDMLAAKGGE